MHAVLTWAQAVGYGAGQHVVEEALEVGAELEDVELQEIALARLDLVLVADQEENGDLQGCATERPQADIHVRGKEEEAVDPRESTVHEEQSGNLRERNPQREIKNKDCGTNDAPC